MMNIQAQVKTKWNADRVLRESSRKVKKYLYRSGGLLRTMISRTLRRARKIRVSELPDEDREQYLEDLEDFRAGLRDKRPELRTIASSPGELPLLQMKPSPLKRGLKFSVDEANAVTLVGPERRGSGSAAAIEKRNPFVRPGLDKFIPQIPGILAQTMKG